MVSSRWLLASWEQSGAVPGREKFRWGGISRQAAARTSRRSTRQGQLLVDQDAAGHAVVSDTARLRLGDPALGPPLRAARRKAAAFGQPAQGARAAADCIHVAIPRLPLHGP